MVPVQVTNIPLFLFFRTIKWTNSFYPLIVPFFFRKCIAYFPYKAVYIYHTEEELKVDETLPGAENIYIDFAGDKPIGIEILNVEELPVVEEL